MAKTELKTDAANVALRAAAIVGVMYGFGFLLMPYAMFQLSGDQVCQQTQGGCAGLEALFSVLRRPMARIRGMGKGGAVHSWCRGSLYSVRPRAAL
jgi:hypothetical protein